MSFGLGFNTASFCNTCYRRVAARVRVEDDGVWLHKQCPVHGPHPRAMVERDPTFYVYVHSLNNPSIYESYFIDVTRRCQLSCSPCFYRVEKADPKGMFTVANIVGECAANFDKAPFVFTGGEPTLHPELETLIKEVSQIGPFELLTNGLKLADPAFYDRIMPLITRENGIANLNLSLHLKETAKWKVVIDQCRKDKVKIESALIVVDSKVSFLEAVQLSESLKDVVQSFRIKGASRLWAEQRPTERVFCSDMLKWLEEANWQPKFVLQGRQNKVVFVNVLCRSSLFLMLVSWNDVANVDLNHINCAPYYRARNGEVCNLVTANIINEGLDAGFLNGQPVLKQQHD